MTVAKSSFQNEFTLNTIYPCLEKTRPTRKKLDLQGNWQQTFDIYTLTEVCDPAGSLTLSRKIIPGNQAKFRLEQERLLPNSHRQKIEANIYCDTAGLPKPTRWSFQAEMIDETGKSIEAVGTKMMAEIQGNQIVYHGGSRHRTIELGPSYTINWLLFDAVQRLPRESFAPLEFSMLDHFDQVKDEQRLSYTKSVEIEMAGQAVTLHAYDHVGRGILPWVYWVDDECGLQFAVAGIEAYVRS